MRIILILLMLTMPVFGARNLPKSTGMPPVGSIDSFDDTSAYFVELYKAVDTLWRQVQGEIQSIVEDEISNISCNAASAMSTGTYWGSESAQTFKVFESDSTYSIVHIVIKAVGGLYDYNYYGAEAVIIDGDDLAWPYQGPNYNGLTDDLVIEYDPETETSYKFTVAADSSLCNKYLCKYVWWAVSE